MRVIKLDRTDSTNNYAKEHIEKLTDRTIIHALRQTNGRGRLNREWVDLGDGNLFCTIVLKPSDNFKTYYSNLTQYTGVVLCRIFENYGLNAKIKWPNDVMIDGERKISGILCETVIEGNKLKGLTLGVGVNLNAKDKDVKNIPNRVVTALNLEINKNIDMEKFLDEFLSEFFSSYDEFLKKGFECIKSEYINRNCFLNKELNVQVLNSVKSGFAKNINDIGELVLQTDTDKELILNIGDIL